MPADARALRLSPTHCQQVTRHEGYTKSADVFSYGMLLFELIAHEVPFADRPPLQAAVAIGLQDLRPPLPPETPPPIERLVKMCWARRPQSRPKFEEVIALLNEAHGMLTAEEIRWLDAPSGHAVYGNKESGREPDANPPPVGGARPAARAPNGMAAILEANRLPQAPEQKLTISGT